MVRAQAAGTVVLTAYHVLHSRLWLAPALERRLVADTCADCCADYWNVSDRMSPGALVDEINFFKNLALAGALLFFLASKREMARLYVNEKLKAA